MTEDNKELVAVDKSTGEITQVTTFEQKLDRVAIEDAKKQFQYLKEFKESILEAGVDYDVIPGTDRVAILQPAGQKLARAFQIVVDYDINEKIEDFWKVWSYPKRQQDGSHLETEVRGWAYYRVTCKIMRMRDRAVICQGFGVATSSDKGAEEKPFHSLLLSAKKRAMMNGVLEATASSGLFMADLDEFPELRALVEQRAQQKEERRKTEPASDKQIGFLNVLKNQRELTDELAQQVESFCQLERDKQLKADAINLITKLKALPERTSKKSESSSKKSTAKTAAESSQQQHSQSNSSFANSEVISDIARMEQDLWGERKDMGNMVNRSRIEYCGSIDLRKSTEVKLRAYATWLASELGA